MAKKSIYIFIACIIVFLSPALLHSQELEEILEMDLQQLMLMEVTVTSASKRPQKFHETASAAYVLTQEDIRRSGAVNIMEDGDPVAYLEEAGLDFTLLLDGDAVAEQYGIQGTPGVIIVDTKQQIRFDLRKLPGPDIGPGAENMSNRQKARRLAPYWAAEIRMAIDRL